MQPVEVPNYVTLNARIAYRIAPRVQLSFVAQQFNAASQVQTAGPPVERRLVGTVTVRMNFVTEMIGEPGAWRLRKGDWRAIFVIEGADVVVTRVGNRREIYR